nr:LysR family transcriptional regulator [Bradyrhizobium acaciae]
MSQPPLSKRIADLESELGLKLFDRTSKKVTLTRTGEAFLPQARNAVQAFDAALRAVRSLAPSQSRQLRIAFPPETSRSMLLAVVSRLQQERVEVHVIEASTSEQQRLLAAGEIDVGVLRHPFEERGLRISAPLGQPLGVVVDVEHPLANVDRLSLRNLSPYPMVHFQRQLAPGLYDELLNLCRAGGYVPSRILQTSRMTKAFLRTESAVALAAERLAKRRGEAGSKEFIWKPLKGSPIHWWTSVVCRADEYVGLNRAAVDVLFASLQQYEKWTPLPRPIIGQQGKGGTKHRIHGEAQEARKHALTEA